MLKQQFPNKILWLASYPKSGNTWFRALLTGLMNDGKVEINDLDTDGIFSGRKVFDWVADIDSSDLYDTEAKMMMADVYRNIALETDQLSILKVHDAFETDAEGNNIIPEDVTYCAIYLIRNPLDIAGSFANHNHSDIQVAVDVLNNRDACLARQAGNLNIGNQFRQNLSDWSGHVKSWTEKPAFPVCVIRYEDMLANTFETFSRALAFIGWEYEAVQVRKAINAASFDALKMQEAGKGFREKMRASPEFFRSGTKGNWEKELNTAQIEEIKAKHKEVMNKYGY